MDRYLLNSFASKNRRSGSSLPVYRDAVDWDRFYAEYPPPDIWYAKIFQAPTAVIEDLQNVRFQQLIKDAWQNEFYQRRWSDAGVEPGDIRGIEDIVRLPPFNSDDIKDDQAINPPFGSIMGVCPRDDLPEMPLKVQTSGGTTGLPRPTLFGPIEWELNGLTMARELYVQGACPGDVLQIPTTCSLANFAWSYCKGAHEYLGVLPVTTGSGVVTPSRRQLEIAEQFGTNLWATFPEYALQLAKTSREEFGRDVRDLKTKFITSYLGPDLDGSLRKSVEEAWGCPVYDNYGTHETGGAAFEGPEKDGLYLMEDVCYFEVLDVDTNQPVRPGETGNLTVTLFQRRVPPLVRFNLRDLARLLPRSRSALNSNFRRMDHFLGRSDAMVKLRGTNVYPMACLGAVKSDSRTTGEWLCVVDQVLKDGTPRDEMTVRVELRRGATATDDLVQALERRLHSDLGVRVSIELVEEGTLAELANLGREGKPRRLLDRRKAAGRS